MNFKKLKLLDLSDNELSNIKDLEKLKNKFSRLNVMYREKRVC